MRVNRRTVLGGAGVAMALASGAAARAQSSGGGQVHAEALGALEAYMGRHREAWGLPGMVCSVADRSGFEGVVTAGYANLEKRESVTPDHLFQVGSISKMIAGLTIWSLMDDGKLSLDDRLNDILPTVRVRDDRGITVRQLLNHTSGLPRGAPVFPEGGLWTGPAPGERWAYSNLGYRLVGLIVEELDGRPYPDSVEARILRPLGMNASAGGMKYIDRARHAQGYEPVRMDIDAMPPEPMVPAPWVESAAASGCVAATGADMTRFLRFLLDLADGRGAPVLSEESAKRFLAEAADAPGWGGGAKYGSGVAHVSEGGHGYLHHTGGMISFCSSLHVDPKAGVAAFASANVHYALQYRPRGVSTYACRLLAAATGGEPAPRPPVVKPAMDKPARYAGVFTAENGDSFSVVEKDGGVVMRRNGRESALRQAAGDYFASRDPEFATTGVVFERENDKAVRAWTGAVEYLADPSTGYKPPASADLQAFAGRYDTDDRWSGPVQVFARDGALWLGNARRLTKLDDGDWRIGDDSAERARFDSEIGGRPHRLILSGVPYIRRFS